MRLAAALLLAAVLVGCGTDDDQRFAQRGNAICREAKQQARGDKGLRRLRALEPPAHLRAERDRFFADLAALALLAPVDTPSKQAQAAELVSRLPGEARALGWTDCAG